LLRYLKKIFYNSVAELRFTSWRLWTIDKRNGAEGFI
jgi:hypothetical protein